MKKNYIHSQIKRICLLNSAISFFVLIIIIILAINIPFTDVFFPVSMSYANSAATVYDSDVEYIEITLNNAEYTGYDCIRRGKIYGSYYYCLVNNNCTFVLVKNDLKSDPPRTLNNYTIKARLTPADKNARKMISGFSKDLGWTRDGLEKVSSEIIIDETAYHMDVYTYLAFSLATLALILVSFIITNIIYFILPGFFPACLYFNRLSDGRHEISHVNFELTSRVILRSGNITLTEHYIVATSPFNIEIIPINKIVWAYEHSTWHHILWFKVKLTYTLHILCEHRIYVYSPRNTKEEIDTVITYLQDNYPNIVFGYTKENKKTALNKSRSKKR